MKVGITYDLKDDYIKLGFKGEEIAEFDSEETISGIEKALQKSGFETERIGNINSLVKALGEGKKWDIVFNIAEGLYGFGRESQVPALLDAYKIPYTFSDTMVLALTLHKGMAKHVVNSFGIETSPFKVVNKIDEIDKIELTYPLFVKPVAEGTGKGISGKSLVNNKKELEEICKELIHKFKQPVIVEEYLPGREFTVGIIGTGKRARVAGVIEVSHLKENTTELVYGYHTKSEYLDVVKYTVPEEDIIKKCSKVALASWRALECRDGGRIDIRFNRKNKPSFIEVNPLAGLNPIHSDLPILCKKAGISFDMLINEIMNSAMLRIKSRKEKAEIKKWQAENSLNAED
ncbi:MAG: ATP-grasp domain-containing protein [Candidatus Muirbacterium halophilum]|nr:ATP-grasp domain-containing protein [Candidatus Muirbacterium halophilum]MCK9474277.1 ATP-grasp domain-containing protein [Candidatus Muirbacterium halophilum]